MKLWRVIGIDADTGTEGEITVRASAASVARLMAERKGLTVAEVIDLEEPATVASNPTPPIAPPKEPPRAAPRRGQIICPNPNCGYVGDPLRKARGSLIVALILLLFFLIPGILYWLFFSGYRYYCPRCRVQLSNDF